MVTSPPPSTLIPFHGGSYREDHTPDDAALTPRWSKAAHILHMPVLLHSAAHNYKPNLPNTLGLQHRRRPPLTKSTTKGCNVAFAVVGMPTLIFSRRTLGWNVTATGWMPLPHRPPPPPHSLAAPIGNPIAAACWIHGPLMPLMGRRTHRPTMPEACTQTTTVPVGGTNLPCCCRQNVPNIGELHRTPSL